MHRTVLVAVLSTIAVWLAAPQAAGAHMLPRSVPPSRMSPQGELDYGLATERHARLAARRWGAALRWLTRHRPSPQLDLMGTFHWQLARDHAAIMLRGHLWLGRYGARVVSGARARMGPAHLTGWRCITHGSHFDDTGAHEGNGYYGQYAGPLGMTTPWLGQMPPGRDWVHSDPLAVYEIAEKVAARHGFGESFMIGQWPNTYPPCRAYF